MQKGLIYQANAIDEDSFKTCLPDEILPCPCSEVFYVILNSHSNSDLIVTIDSKTGDVRLKEGVQLKNGDNFTVEIVASSTLLKTSLPKS